jgi:hypothetical protein
LGKEIVGKWLTQRGIIKYAVPVASVAVGGTWNYVATLIIGNHAKKYFKQRGGGGGTRPLIPDVNGPIPDSGGIIIDHLPEPKPNEL